MDIENRLRKLLGTKGYQLFLQGLEIAEKTGDPAWIYHMLSTLKHDYYGGETWYPPPEGEYFKPSIGDIELPKPRTTSGTDTLHAIRKRRSRRSYSGPITLQDVSDILYYSIGVTGIAWWGGPKRAYPSAGALQPIEAYLVAGQVEGLSPGIYHYNPGLHRLTTIRTGHYMEKLADIALEQHHVGEAPAAIILTAVVARTATKYGYRSYRYIHLDAGHAGENIYLASEALGLATVAVGAFYDEELCKLLSIQCEKEIPLLIYPIGLRTRRHKRATH